MGAWPDWWPKNPIGDTWDSAQKWWDQWQWIIYLIIGLIVAVIVAALYFRIRG